MRVSAVLLAAGESRRMGALNKLTLPIAGEPLVRRSAKTLLKIELQEIVCVLGHESEQIAELLAGLELSTVVNENYQDGQMTSVETGLAALQQQSDAILICVADLPLLSARDIDVLIAEFAQLTNKSILVPYFQGQRGNPILIAAQHRQSILAGKTNLGCKKLIERHPELVAIVEMANNHCVLDMDDYSAYEKITSCLQA